MRVECPTCRSSMARNSALFSGVVAGDFSKWNPIFIGSKADSAQLVAQHRRNSSLRSASLRAVHSHLSAPTISSISFPGRTIQVIFPSSSRIGNSPGQIPPKLSIGREARTKPNS